MVNYQQLLQMMNQNQTTPATGYTLQNGTMVMPAEATGRARVGATGNVMAQSPTVPAGQTGGAGMAMPEGATAIGGGGTGAAMGGVALGLIDSLGSAASSYVQSSAEKKALLPPHQPALANFPVATVGQRSQLHG